MVLNETVKRNSDSSSESGLTVALTSARGGMGDLKVGSFMEFAACRGVDPAIFYPKRGESSAEAQAICHSCSVMNECLEHALEHNELYGVWGGESEFRRKKLRRTGGYLAVASGCKGKPEERPIQRVDKATCAHGHEKTIHWHIDGAARGYCKECHRLRGREWRDKVKEMLNG